MRKLWALVVVGALAACSAEGSGGSGSTTPGGGSGAVTSLAPDAMAAALSGASTLPVDITPAAIASANGIDVVVGETWITPGSTVQSAALAAVRRDQGPWQLLTIDNGVGYAPPLTASDPNLGWKATDVAAGPGGFVAVGGAAFFAGTIAAGYGGLVWYSADGSSWTRIDVRGMLAQPDFKGIQLTSVAATSAGYVVIGRDGEKKSLVFFSADGQNWTLAAETTFRWAVLPKGLFADGDRVVAWYDEFECLDDTFASGTQPVLLSSLDGGVSWASVNMSAVPTLSKFVPEADAAACAATGTDFSALAAAFRGGFSAIGVAGGQFVVVDEASNTIAVSADTVTWTSAALPAPRPNTTSVSFYTLGNAFRVFASGDSMVVMTRSLPATPTGDMLLIGWSSADGGATWSAVGGTDAGSATTQVVFNPQPDGRVMVILQPRDNEAHVVDPATVAELTLGVG